MLLSVDISGIQNINVLQNVPQFVPQNPRIANSEESNIKFTLYINSLVNKLVRPRRLLINQLIKLKQLVVEFINAKSNPDSIP